MKPSERTFGRTLHAESELDELLTEARARMAAGHHGDAVIFYQAAIDRRPSFRVSIQPLLRSALALCASTARN